MRVFAYCTERAAKSVAKATGVKPITSPPMTADKFRPEWLEGHDLLYIRLHGSTFHWSHMIGQGDSGENPTALTAEIIERADLGGAVVVLANCYAAETPLADAFYRAGAGAVIAGSGPNIALGDGVAGPDLLVRWLILGLSRGLSVKRSLQLAKLRLIASIWREPDRDALEFHIMEKSEQ